MFCHKCGNSLNTKTNFCPHCGEKLEDATAASLPVKRKAPVWFKALLTSILLICVLVLSLVVLSEDPTDIIAGQLKLIRKDRITEAYYNFTSKAFQEATSLERFREFVQHYPTFSQNKTIRFVDRVVEDDVGKIEALLFTANGEESQVQYQLIKENEKWKILSIKMEELSLNN